MSERMPEFPFGYWENPLDRPEHTVQQDITALAQLETELAEPTPVVNQELERRLGERMKADGIEVGVDLRYILQVIYGYLPAWDAQIIGSCVASGSMRAITVRALYEILLLGQLEPAFGEDLLGTGSIAPFAPYHYRWGRHHAGIHGYRDGSTCRGQIAALQQEGILLCSTPELDQDADALPEPSARIYRTWGATNQLAQEYLPHAQVALKETTRPQDTEQLWNLLTIHRKPCMICSSWGFTPARHHAAGFWVYRRRGTWPHNMTLAGCRQHGDDRYFLVWNSWGDNAHKDGAVFWVDESTMAAWLPNSACQTIGELNWKTGDPQ